MSLLDPEHTVQESPSMSAVVASVRAWIAGDPRTCVVVASEGSGKSYLLKAARYEVGDPLVMPAANGGDCTEFLARLKYEQGRAVLADDLDRFSKEIRERVIDLVAESSHMLLASMTKLNDRTKNLLCARCPDGLLVFLDDLASRPQDVEMFVERWVSLIGLTGNRVGFGDCAKFCCASGLPRGFRTLQGFLDALAGAGWSFEGPLPAADAASAYRQATAPPPTRPTILVEGYTDRLYLEWLLQGMPSPPVVEVRDCGGATIVAEQAIALRNQGRSCVAVLDSDVMGKELRASLSKFRHPVVSVPVEAVNLPKSAYDHVQQVAEIEDLLPVTFIEEFLRLQDRQAELEIRAPTGARYVISETDKRDLARWIVEDKDRDSVPRLAALLREALKMLGIGV